MNWQSRTASFLARTPVHSILARLHHKLDRYMDIARNWNNGDESTNGEAHLIRRAAGRWQVVFDIGANVGNWSAAVLGFNPHCTVYAFEPAPATFARLKTRLQDFANLRPYQMGMGDREQRLGLHEHEEDPGLSSFLSRELSVGLKARNNVEVPLTTVDAFCAAHGIGMIDMVKIDTEGYEMAVLRGMRECLAAKRVSMIQFEYGGTWLDAHETLALANQWLRNAGYGLYRLRAEGAEMVVYDSRQHECFKYSNFLAVAVPETLHSWGVPVVAGR